MENTCKRITFYLQNLFILLQIPCSFLFIESIVFPVTGDSHVTPYNPIENITIDCGSSSNSLSLDRRIWIGDDNGKFSPLEQQNNNRSSVALNAFLQPPPSVDPVPFATARLSYSEFTYSIPLSAGQKFIRFYFYPVAYPSFNDPSNKAFFSVKAGPFTLLKNFSALLHAGREHTLVKEFCVNVNEGERQINITFTPNPDISDSYAFINGVEIVSMPTNLYYRPDDDGVPFVGQRIGSLYTIGNKSALEMSYRINVGGSQILPTEDTGMFRLWSEDYEYLTIENPTTSASDSANITFSANLTFNYIASFSAPREIYVTSRSMGINKTVNNLLNLTWDFLVDSGFNYFVRLHFCENLKEITKPGDRVFKIFLANFIVENQADVIVWSGGNRIPVYMDYVVAIGRKGYSNQEILSITLHPAPEWSTLYSDAILNGLEIFKLSNKLDLATPNREQESYFVPFSKNIPSKWKSGKNRKVITVVVVPISVLVAVSLLMFFIFRKRANRSAKQSIPDLTSDNCRHFSLKEIKTASNNFDKDFIIGRGGFGDVYKGLIDDGSTPVAIKRLSPGSKQGVLEFRTEIELLSRLRHQNLVSLIGCCKDRNELILVYDYMVHGTLRDHLYNTSNNNSPLQWDQRLGICIGAAHGIHYLHTGPNHTIIHRDVKTTNILLDEKWVAKVSDFGLSKMNDMSKTHISTAVKGSFGYFDPEYYRLQRLTEKSDVYSFGVVLSEVLCGRAPIDRSRDDPTQISLAEWVKHCYNNGTLDQIIDPHLQGQISPQSLLKYSEVAISCLASEGNKRPAMSEVVYGLELALHFQLQGSEVNRNNENHVINDSTNMDYHVLFSSGSGSMHVGR